MSRTFTTATDDSLIALIAGAQNRLAVIAPGLTTPVARALAARMKELPTLSLTVILDADAEVYRMGYGDAEALGIIRETSINACLSGYHPHPLYVVCLLGLQARVGAGALRRRSG